MRLRGALLTSSSGVRLSRWEMQARDSAVAEENWDRCVQNLMDAA
jgi:hypothetical protein